MVRPTLVLLHRWVGLATAVFLAVAGLTGTVIAFHRELDAWLNPAFFHPTPVVGPTLPANELVRRVEAAEPRFRVTYAPLRTLPGRAAELYGEPRLDPSGKPFELGFDEVFAEPTTGEIVGRRTWGACCLEREHLIPFLYRVHYSLKIPGNWGTWLMGAVAAAWVIDCFVGLWLTFPRGRPFLTKWRPAWRVKRGAGGFRLAFDLHRAAGLWLWGLLLVLAVSSVSFNLYEELFKPLVQVLSPLTPYPLDAPAGPFKEPRLSFEDAGAAAAAEGERRGWADPPAHAFYSPSHDVYGVDFRPVHAYDRPGLGSPVLYVDGADGRLLGARVPGEGTWGDAFEQLQYPLHSGQVAGLPGRIFIASVGIVVAGLSVTGVLVWAKKRASAARARNRRATGGAEEPRPSGNESRTACQAPVTHDAA